jgi:hypothetical protein
MRIVSGRWSELGSPTEPGDYHFEYEKEQLRVRVMPQDIEEAKANGGPDAVFRASGPEKDTGGVSDQPIQTTNRPRSSALT